ncbi:ankyrin [Aspergillus ellipticus CBS 707.79]|uniref:Ankyrin n=1 Tax=Aspergillus ellipticus CBS 707.79 TaxID=1448320 RepID=A0A319D448_9EURO|nr:ankyrin [Aspergillus ellipticus CBS 707.79]
MLLSLPTELLLEVAKLLDPKCFAALCKVCRDVRSSVQCLTTSMATEYAKGPAEHYCHLIEHKDGIVHRKRKPCSLCPNYDPNAFYRPVDRAEKRKNSLKHLLYVPQPLFDAVRGGDCARVQSFLEAGVDPNIYSRKGLRPLYLCGPNVDMTNLLLRYGANPNLPSPKSWTLLDSLCWTWYRYLSRGDDEEVVWALLRAGGIVKLDTTVQVLCQVDSTLDALKCVARNGTNFADMLDGYADCDYAYPWMNPEKGSILHTLLTTAEYESLDCIIETAPSTLHNTLGGVNVLSWAIYEGHRNAALYLLKKGVKVQNLYPEAEDPLLSAMELGHSGVLEELLNHPGLDPDDQHWAECVRILEQDFNFTLMSTILRNERHGRRVLELMNMKVWEGPYASILEARARDDGSPLAIYRNNLVHILLGRTHDVSGLEDLLNRVRELRETANTGREH